MLPRPGRLGEVCFAFCTGPVGPVGLSTGCRVKVSPVIKVAELMQAQEVNDVYRYVEIDHCVTQADD